MAIEEVAYTRPELQGMYPLSLSARTQVLKGRLNSNEVVPYFSDLSDPSMEVHSMFFHTRFSTNTAPNATMAQPFRLMAHNGELNTDKKNRLSDNAIALARNRAIIRPHGQSDSCRLDQTLQNRVLEDDLDLVTAVVAMMPPAWENDPTLSPEVRAMLEFFSLYEEKNDGPAALIFGDGRYIGARLDRLGLRPLRTVETAEYLGVMSEAGQLYFEPDEVTKRGRIEAGGMLYYDHSRRRSFTTVEALEMLAAQQDYPAMVAEARVNLDELPAVPPEGPAVARPLQRRPEPLSAVRGVLAESGELQVPDGPDARHGAGEDLRDGVRRGDQRAVQSRRRHCAVLLAAIRPGDQPAAGQHPRGRRDDAAGRARREAQQRCDARAADRDQRRRSSPISTC